jgi:hypothetical protein
MRWIGSFTSAVALLLPIVLGAQEPESPLHGSSAGGLHAGSPAAFSVAIGALREVSATSDGRTQAVFALVEPGVRAGRLSVGYGNAYGTLGTGWTIRATALRVWRGTIGNYLGGEASLMALGLGPRVGVFRQIGSGTGSSSRVTLDFAFGL